MQWCGGSFRSAQVLCWQPVDQGQWLGIFYLGLHRIRGFVLLIHNIRKQRSHTHTHTHTHTCSPQIQPCAFAWEPALCPGGGQRVAEAKYQPLPTDGLVGTTPSPRWRPQSRHLCCVLCLPLVWGEVGLEHVRVCTRVGCFFVCSAPVLLIDLIHWPFQVRGQHTVRSGPTLVS